MIRNEFLHSASRMKIGTAMVAVMCCQAVASGQGLIRSKKPDRGVYTPPTIGVDHLQKVKIAAVDPRESPADDDQDFAERLSVDPGSLVPAPLTTVEPIGVDDSQYASSGQRRRMELPEPVRLESVEQTSQLQTVGYQEVAAELRPFPENIQQDSEHNVIAGQNRVQSCSCESCSRPVVESSIAPHGTSYGTSYDVGCDSGFCGGFDSSCDSMGCDGCGACGNRSSDWFGSVEVLLMFRAGDRLPALVTSGPGTDPATDGRLDQATTNILSGQEKILEELTPGGRLTIGRWLDGYKDRSLVGRLWLAGEQSDDDSFAQSSLARPFFNVTDALNESDDVLQVAFPGESVGQIDVRADTNVYGADLSIRQLRYKRFGGTVDLLYGYQYVGLDESLSITSRSTSQTTADPFRPFGSMISTDDSFEIENDFHGGQVGIATNYREGCWSFSSLAKIGFGAIERKATLTGTSGLLVQPRNAGTHRDRTFGWSPELDFTFGWQKYPAFDLTFGYNLVVLTDALQLSGVVDPRLAVNLDATGTASPTSQFRYDTFYVHGLHFGLSYIY